MMEIGIYSFGHQARRPDGSLESTSQSIADLMEGVRLADEVGLDFFPPSTAPSCSST